MARPSKTGIKGLHKDKRGRWCIDFRYRDPSTREMRRHTEDLPIGITAVAAKERTRLALNAAYAGELRTTSDGPHRLNDALDQYVEWCETNRPRTIGDRRYLSAVLKRHLGNVPLSELSPFNVERLKRDRAAEGVAPATVNRAVAMLKHFIGLASKWGWMPADLAISLRTVRLLTEPPGRIRYLTEDEAVQLIGALRDDVRAIACTALLTGMRLGELTGLTKNAIDFDAGLITLTQTKTNRIRRVPIHQSLAPILRFEMARSTSLFVFTNRHGRPHSHRATKIFRDTARHLGIQDLRFHDLRHDFATKIRLAGAGLDVIATLLGHTTLAMTQRYAHLGLSTLRDAVDLLAPPTSPSDAHDQAGTLLPFPPAR